MIAVVFPDIDLLFYHCCNYLFTALYHFCNYRHLESHIEYFKDKK